MAGIFLSTGQVFKTKVGQASVLVDRQPNQLGGELGRPLDLALGEAGLQSEVVTLDVAQFAHPVPKDLEDRSGRGR